MVLVSQHIHAQVQLDDYVGNLSENFENNTTGIMAIKSVDVEGNPMMFEEFVVGVLVNSKSQTVPLKLNLDLSNNMILVNQDNKIIGISTEAVTSIEIQNPKMTLKKGYNTQGKDDLNKNSLFHVLFEGENYTVLKHSGVTLQKDVSSYGTAVQKDVYITYSELYLVNADGEFDGLSTRKRKFFSVFGDDKKEVEKYANNNKLDIKNENDLALIFKYAESLHGNS